MGLVTHADSKYTYSSWASARRRCRSKTAHNYKWYGGRGIKFCERWDDFGVFLEDMGERPKNHTIDRIDPDGNYEPGNCRWATYEEQKVNKRNTVRLKYRGNSYTLRELADYLGIKRATIKNRYYIGMDIEDIVQPDTTGNTLREKHANKHLYNGKLYTIAELSLVLNIPKSILHYRAKHGKQLDSPYNPRK